MRLRLSALHLRAIMVLVVSRQKGITLVFKNDPLESVNVSSSFDSVGVIQGYIQREIEGQLREMFRNDLPSIIHKLSQRWLSESGAKAAKPPNQPNASPPQMPLRSGFDYPLPDGQHRQLFGPASSAASQAGSIPMSNAPSAESHLSMPSKRTPMRPRIIKSPSEVSQLSVADEIENYDPTYGMRPEEMASAQGYKRVGKLWSSDQRGLSDALYEDEAPDADEDESWQLPSSPIQSETQWSDHDSYIRSMQGLDCDRLPAVGGGFISRPRVIHSQSQMPPNRRHSSASHYDHPTPLAVPRSRPMYSRSNTADVERLWLDQETPSLNNRRPYLNTMPSSQSVPSMASSPLSRSLSGDSPSSAASPYSRSSSLFFQPTQSSSYSSLASSRSLSPLTPGEETEKPRSRSEGRKSPSPPPFLDRRGNSALPDLYNTSDDIEQPGITLDPKQNEMSAHLASLANNHQTFSIFTRPFDHFTARSFPRPVGKGKKSGKETPGVDRIPAKGRQKRVHRFGAAAEAEKAKSVGGTPLMSPRMDDDARSISSMSSYFPRQNAPPIHLQRPLRPGFRQTHSEYVAR